MPRPMEDPHEQIKIKMKLIFVIANQYSVGGPEIDALWEDAWLIRHAHVEPGYTVLDVGGASTTFSFYLASLGCHVVIVDNDIIQGPKVQVLVKAI